MNKKTIDAVKYSGTSVVLGSSLVSILLFAFPNLEAISQPITALIIFAVNIALVKSGVISESE